MEKVQLNGHCPCQIKLIPSLIRQIFHFTLYLQTNVEFSANKFTIPIKMKQNALRSNYVNSDMLQDSGYYDGGPILCPIFWAHHYCIGILLNWIANASIGSVLGSFILTPFYSLSCRDICYLKGDVYHQFSSLFD